MDTNTESILDWFDQISAIPRCSGNEAQIGRWLQQWADDHNFKSRSDDAGNLVVHIPASPGYESAPTVVIQGHMDMVCEKTPASAHDFKQDPIRVRREGKWLAADQTTLGADNGIAIAYMLALVGDTRAAHPPLELLFTVDEESGLNGVKKMPADFINGKIFLNIDSEEQGVFTIGCAGGTDTKLTRDMPTAPVPPNNALFKIEVGGLIGGHSGIEIHKQRGNANIILARLLKHARRKTSLRIVRIDGGTGHNVIPRNATAVVACDAHRIDAVQTEVLQFGQTIKDEIETVDPNLTIRCETLGEPRPTDTCLSPEDSDHTTALLLTLPHGVAGYVKNKSKLLVETSNNLATVTLASGRLAILSSQRSALMSRLAEITAKIHAIAALAGAKAQDGTAYPAWPPNWQSELLKRCLDVYRQLHGQASKVGVEVIHAGLECAIVGDKYTGMDMISFGPTIHNAHSPDEKMNIESVGAIYRFLVALLKSMQ